jgi:hypothetical protein
MSRLPFASAQREGRGDMRESEVYADKGVTTPPSTTTADPPAAIHHLDLGGGAKAVLPSAGADSAPATMTEPIASDMTLEGGITATLPSSPIPAATTSSVQVRLLPPPSLRLPLLASARRLCLLRSDTPLLPSPLPCFDALLAPLHCPPVRHLSRLSGCAQALGDKNGAESGIISEPSITTGAVWMAEGVRSLSRTIKDPLVRVYATPLGKLAHDALALKRPSSSCATTGKQLNGMPSSPASAEPPDSSHLTTLPSAAHLMTPVLGSTIASEPDPQDLHCKIPVGACAVVQNGSSSHVTPGAGAGPAIPRLDPAHVYKVHPTPPTRPPPAFAVERCGPGCWCRPVHCNDAIATVSHARRLSCCSICSGRAAQAGLCNDCRAHYRWVAGRDRRTRRQRVTQGAGR